MKITDNAQAARYIRVADILTTVEWKAEGKNLLALRTSKAWLVVEKGVTGNRAEVQSQELVDLIDGAPIFFFPRH